MKILNKYPVLADVVQLGENSIQFKFKKTPYFDNNKDLFIVNVWGLKIVGDDIKAWIEALKEQHANSETVLTVEDYGMEIFTGNFDEHPDWGSWGTTFVPFGFETYDTGYILKTQEDWDRELLQCIKMKVSEKMYQSVTDPDFRDWIYKHCESQFKYTVLNESQQRRIENILDKVNQLEASKFYLIFAHDSKFEID